MMLAIPDHDIKDMNFFKKRNEVEHILLSIKKISFLIFYDNGLKIAFDSSDDNFPLFLENFKNVYPVSYQVYGTTVQEMKEVYFLRSAIFPLNPHIDVLSFIANYIENRKSGSFKIEIERSKIPFHFFRRIIILKKMKNLRNYQERKIAEEILEKLSQPIFRARIYTSYPELLRIAYDFRTGQGLRERGKKIFMSAGEIAYFIHYPLSLNNMRKPW